MKTPRFYLDTSVFGGFFDEEFAAPTQRLFEELWSGRFVGLLSDVSLRELRRAPAEVVALQERGDGVWELLAETQESLNLSAAYIQAGVVSERFMNDCLHVAIATVHGADALVSWNFRHIVQFHRIRGFNAVNMAQGYGIIDIRSPQEVVDHE